PFVQRVEKAALRIGELREIRRIHRMPPPDKREFWIGKISEPKLLGIFREQPQARQHCEQNARGKKCSAMPFFARAKIWQKKNRESEWCDQWRETDARPDCESETNSADEKSRTAALLPCGFDVQKKRANNEQHRQSMIPRQSRNICENCRGHKKKDRAYRSNITRPRGPLDERCARLPAEQQRGQSETKDTKTAGGEQGRRKNFVQRAVDKDEIRRVKEREILVRQKSVARENGRGRDELMLILMHLLPHCAAENKSADEERENRKQDRAKRRDTALIW